MLRGCYGWSSDSQIDKQFVNNIKGCEANGIPYGVYHYSYARNTEEAVKEAKFFIHVLEKCKANPTYPVAFDFEDPNAHGKLSNKQKADICYAFCSYLENAGYYVILYSMASWLTNYLNDSRLDKFDKWVAHVNVSKPSYKKPYGIWQYSWKGSVSGIKGNVDLNYSYKNYHKIIKDNKLNKIETNDEANTKYQLVVDVVGKKKVEDLRVELSRKGFTSSIKHV